jgi:hypothetical protein
MKPGKSDTEPENLPYHLVVKFVEKKENKVKSISSTLG